MPNDASPSRRSTSAVERADLPGGHEDPRPFWERPDTLERFASMPVDEGVARRFETAAPSRILDLGCAAGRNAAWLAGRGHDVHALDASPVMVAHTRGRLAEHYPDADMRVRQADMRDLHVYEDASFDAVIAIGVLHIAPNIDAWRATVASIARLLKPGGETLIGHFTPVPTPGGEAPTPEPGNPHLYRSDLRGNARLLLHPHEIDAELARVGLEPLTPTRERPMRTVTGHGITTADAHHVKRT